MLTGLGGAGMSHAAGRFGHLLGWCGIALMTAGGLMVVATLRRSDPSHLRPQHAPTWTARVLGDVKELVGGPQHECLPRLVVP
jgi:hypothetical protein